MGDPFSVAASALTIIAAAIGATKALNETVKSYKGRDKTLGRLQGGLEDLITTLHSLQESIHDETPILTLLRGPIQRCTQVCRDFQDAMQLFEGKSRVGLKDWAKMEFMRGDITEFTETLADYKSTIMIALGTITMKTSKLTHGVIEEYSEMIKDTAYHLEVRLQRIDEKMEDVAAAHRTTSLQASGVNLQDEKAVTIQCLRICEDASLYLKSLEDGQQGLQGGQGAEFVLSKFEAQLLTQKTLDENRVKLAETIGCLRERLAQVTLNEGLDSEDKMLRLTQQCLAVCKEAATQVSGQKIHVIGEVIADQDCDQVVVTALADLFNVGKVKASSRSAQLVGSMPPDVLRDMSKHRYGSRFGALGGIVAPTQLDNAAASSSGFEARIPDTTPRTLNKLQEREPLGPEATHDKPSPNEVRRRRLVD